MPLKKDLLMESDQPINVHEVKKDLLMKTDKSIKYNSPMKSDLSMEKDPSLV